jgi:hypothetical protein
MIPLFSTLLVFSGENTYTEVYTLPHRFGSRSQVLDRKSISLRNSWEKQEETGIKQQYDNCA